MRNQLRMRLANDQRSAQPVESIFSHKPLHLTINAMHQQMTMSASSRTSGFHVHLPGPSLTRHPAVGIIHLESVVACRHMHPGKACSS